MKKQPPKSYLTGLRGGFLCSLEFYRTAIVVFIDYSMSLIHITSLKELIQSRGGLSPHHLFLHTAVGVFHDEQTLSALGHSPAREVISGHLTPAILPV